MILGIDHTSFTVSNMEKTIAFYRDVLGMKIMWDSLQAGVEFKGPITDKMTGCPGTEQRLVFFIIGSCKLEFIQFKPPGKPLFDNRASDIGSAHVCFYTEDIWEHYHKLLANGARVHCEPQVREPRKVMFFRDPDGIILEAIEGPPRNDR